MVEGGRFIKIVERADNLYQDALDKWGPVQPVGFPNTAYYLPIIYAMLGHKVEKLADIPPVLARCQALLPPPVRERHPLPYLAPALDAGMAEKSAEFRAALRALVQRPAPEGGG